MTNMHDAKTNKVLTNRRRPAKTLWILNKTLVVTLASVAIVVGYVALINAWHSIYDTASSLDVWLIISVTTFMVITGIVMTGRFLERRLEIDAKLRSQKIDIYDEFLKELSKIFRREHNNDDLLTFIESWQSKLMLWSEGETLSALLRWHHSLVSAHARDQSLLMLDDFIRAMREEIGHPTHNIEQGAFIHLMIDHAAFLNDHSHPSASVNHTA